MKELISKIIRGKGTAEEKAEQIIEQAQKSGLSPWWNSRARWDYELNKDKQR